MPLFEAIISGDGSGPSFNSLSAAAALGGNIAGHLFPVNNDFFHDVDGTEQVTQQITIHGANNSSIVVNNQHINFDVDVSGLSIDFGGNYDLDGGEILHAVLDIGGILDQSGVLDAINAGLYLSEGRSWDAVQSGAGVVPIIGDLAKSKRIAKSWKIIDDAIDASKAGRSLKASDNIFKPLGRVSTGRTIARTISEKWAMRFAKDNPQLGEVIMENMKDKRWSGRSKMEFIHRPVDGGRTVTVHYVGKWVDGVLEAVDDFKFK